MEGALDSEALLAQRGVHWLLAFEASSAAEEFAKLQYEQGVVDISGLLSARRDRLQVEGERLALRRAQLDSRVNLLVALGGGFSAEPTE